MSAWSDKQCGAISEDEYIFESVRENLNDEIEEDSENIAP